MNPIVSVQIYRGIAAWLVVIHHYIQLYGREHSHGLPYFFSNKGGFGVDLFFVISGLLMYITLSRKKYDAYEFIAHRIIRIVPAYWFYTSVLIILSTYFVNEFSLTKWTAQSIILSLIFFPNENPSGLGVFPFLTVGWTLNFEVFFYFCLSAGIFLFGKYKFIACSIFILFLPLLSLNQLPVIWRYADILSDKIIYEFIMGIFIGYLYLKNTSFFEKGSIKIGTVCILFSIIFLYFSDSRKILTFPIWIVPAAGMLLGGLFFERCLKSKIFKFSILLGDISYSTYLVHIIVIGVLKNYFTPATIAQEIMLLIFLACVIFSIFLVSYHIIEKIPARILTSLIKK